MGQELTLPDWAKSGPAEGFAALNPHEDSLSDGIGQSYPVIGYKGKVWSFRHRGERKNFIRPDDGTPASYIDVIILGQAKQKSKSYYKAFDPNQSEGDRPICASIDGVTPDADVTMKQADHCALCPRNAWKVQPNGKKGRECQDYKRLAVLVIPTQTQPLFGEAILEPAFLRVPPASLNSLAIMGDTMSSQGFHYASYITRIQFDPNEAHPKMIFRPFQGLTKEEAPVILQMRENMSVERIIHGGFAETMKDVAGSPMLPAGTAATGLAAPQPTQAGQGQILNLQANPPSIAGPALTAQTPHSTPATDSNGLVSAPLATGIGVSSPAPALSTGITTSPAAPVGTIGSGIVTPAPAQPAPSLTVVGDTGAAEAADEDLDALIAKTLKK
jgi:hypothetical protein